jgi:hypothetical protein
MMLPTSLKPHLGLRYSIIGALKSPDGSTPSLCTVWQLDKEQLAPRLITAYPAKS